MREEERGRGRRRERERDRERKRERERENNTEKERGERDRRNGNISPIKDGPRGNIKISHIFFVKSIEKFDILQQSVEL